MSKILTAPIVEIFRSLEGEGAFIGTPTIFIRLAGCPVGCKHCDSKATWKVNNFPKKTLQEVIDEVARLNSGDQMIIDRVSITGGEPLIHEEFLLSLCNALVMKNPWFTINLETSGTLFPHSIFRPGHYSDYVDTLSLDIKTPSSGVVLQESQIKSLQTAARSEVVYIKAVIDSQKDLNFVLDVFFDPKVEMANELVLTPCEKAGKFFNFDSIFKVLNKRKVDVKKFKIRVITQQHKLMGFR